LQWSSHKFYSTYTRWAEAFGSENVTVIPHETAGDAVEAFFRAADLADALPELRPTTRRKVALHPHVSLVADEVERVLEGSTAADDLPRLRDILRSEAEREGMLRPPRGSLLGPRAAEIVDHFSDEVRQLHERVVALPDVYFVAPEVAPMRQLSPDEVRELSIRLLSNALLDSEKKGVFEKANARGKGRGGVARTLLPELRRRLAAAKTGLWRALGRRRSMH